MPLYHTDDQAMLADTAKPFMAEEGSIQKQLRHWRDIKCKDGFGHDLWKQFAELGFTGMLIDEADGGLGMGHVEAGIVLEEIGRNLTPSPFLSTAVLGATALKRAGGARAGSSTNSRRSSDPRRRATTGGTSSSTSCRVSATSRSPTSRRATSSAFALNCSLAAFCCSIRTTRLKSGSSALYR